MRNLPAIPLLSLLACSEFAASEAPQCRAAEAEAPMRIGPAHGAQVSSSGADGWATPERIARAQRMLRAVQQPALGRQICVDYHPSPGRPDRLVRGCVPSDWPAPSFCWRTGESCAGGRLVGCITIATTGGATLPGVESLECQPEWDCVRNAIDNPPCCGQTAYGLGGDCAATR